MFTEVTEWQITDLQAARGRSLTAEWMYIKEEKDWVVVPSVRAEGPGVHPAAEEVTAAEADAGPACTCPPAACLMEAGDITSDVLRNRSAQAACH